MGYLAIFSQPSQGLARWNSALSVYLIFQWLYESLEAKTWMFVGEEGSKVPSETPTMLILLTTTLEHL